MSDIKDRIRELRRRNGLSQVELGNILDISQRAVSAIESGTNNPTIQQLETLSKHFGVSADYLMFGVEMPTDTDRELLKYIKSDSDLMQSLMGAMSAKKNVFDRLAV